MFSPQKVLFENIKKIILGTYAPDLEGIKEEQYKIPNLLQGQKQHPQKPQKRNFLIQNPVGKRNYTKTLQFLIPKKKSKNRIQIETIRTYLNESRIK